MAADSAKPLIISDLTLQISKEISFQSIHRVKYSQLNQVKYYSVDCVSKSSDLIVINNAEIQARRKLSIECHQNMLDISCAPQNAKFRSKRWSIAQFVIIPISVDITVAIDSCGAS